MEAREPPGDELHAVVQRAVGDDAAQRCTAALRAQGVSAVVDWFVLETADEDLCRDLLTDVAAAEKLSRVQVAKLRLAQPVAVQRVEDGAVPARPVREHERDLERVRQRISTE